MNYLDFPFQIKSLTDKGDFSGYGSVWDVTDRQNDVVRKGAFKEIIRNEDGRVVFLWQHDTTKPIATAAVKQDEIGLRFEGSLILADPVAQQAHAHMKAKSVRGVSIGYDTLDYNALQDGRRELTSIRLWELSLVTFPALPEAQVDAVKSLAACTDPRELKQLLRERDGLSRSKAAAGAEALWRILHGTAGSNNADDDDVRALAEATGKAFEATQRNVESLAAQLDHFHQLLKGITRP